MRRRLYHLFRALVRLAWMPMGGVRVNGLEHVPKQGPFLLIANHQSYLETLLIPAVCPRLVHAMIKSTQFSGPVLGRLLAFIYGFPVRRFEIDPQAVRNTLRRVEEGDGVMIFIEGERSWDGCLQPPRLGTVRLALKAGVPVIPCRVDGAYEAWPRWSRSIQRQRVILTFGEPIRFPRLDSRREREALVGAAAERIMKALSDGF